MNKQAFMSPMQYPAGIGGSTWVLDSLGPHQREGFEAQGERVAEERVAC
jgi:hypothetical protein